MGWVEWLGFGRGGKKDKSKPESAPLETRIIDFLGGKVKLSLWPEYNQVKSVEVELVGDGEVDPNSKEVLHALLSLAPFLSEKGWRASGGEYAFTITAGGQRWDSGEWDRNRFSQSFVVEPLTLNSLEECMSHLSLRLIKQFRLDPRSGISTNLHESLQRSHEDNVRSEAEQAAGKRVELMLVTSMERYIIGNVNSLDPQILLTIELDPKMLLVGSTKGKFGLRPLQEIERYLETNFGEEIQSVRLTDPPGESGYEIKPQNIQIVLNPEVKLSRLTGFLYELTQLQRQVRIDPGPGRAP